MIYSSADIYRTLVNDVIIGASADIKIAEGRPSLQPQDGIIIYVSLYPEVEDFEAKWHVWVVDFDNEPLDIVLGQLRRLFPTFTVLDSGLIVHGTLTEVRTGKTETAPVEPKKTSVDEYLNRMQERFDLLEESIQDRMLLVQSGRPGKDGEPGRDGKDGQDMVATNAKLDDLIDVEVEDAKTDQVLTFKKDKWVPRYVTQRYSGSGGVSKDELDTLVGLTERGEPMGHTDKTESVMTFDDATRTFTIAPVDKQFRVWVKGKRYVIKRSLSVQIPDETGLYFVYFGEGGVLGVQEDYFYWDSEAPTAYIYWNAEDNLCPYFAEERHGIVLDWQTHEYLHRTRGASIASGFDISNYILGGHGSLNSHAQFDLSGGTFFDEDLKIIISHSNTPVAETFQQDLQGPARLPVVYKTGNTWKIDTATDFPVKKGTTHIYYNAETAGTWSLVETSTNKYVNYYVVATNNLRAPVISLMGQVQYANHNDAKAETFSALHLTGFPSKEFRFLYKITYRVNNFNNQVKTVVESIQDIRQYVSLPFSLFL
jgi:hypothetical protein